MNAQPQRPARAFRVQNDENAVPPSNQSLHQRHKSTGTLSNMLAIGGLKAAAKRTVFADVSNTAKATSSVCDDSALPHKPAEFVKPLALQERSAGFFKPAHRSLNVAGPKVASVNTSTTAPSDLALVSTNTKLPLGETRLGQPHPVLPLANKRTLSKRSTAIYKDNVENEVSSQGATRPETAPTAPVHQSLAPRQHKSQPQLPSSTDQSVSHEAPSKFPGTVQSENVEPSNTIYQNTFEEPMMNPDEAYHSYSKLMEHDKEQPAIEVPKPTQTSDDRMHRHLPAPPLASEPEEYWEEDEEEEIYDEQGYTTAHSYRSRGENTTGGATTVLFPKVTNKAKKELAEAKNIVESARTPEEIEDEAWDTSMVAEYGDEIFAYMRELEIKMLPNAHYMDNQAEIQWSMRSVLMDWLVQVHNRFSLLPETLFLCVNYIDRFLSCKIVSLGKLQLVGATAIFVAAKYEEINCPSVGEIVYMVDGGYTVDEILKAERFMLSMLQFELGWPGPMSFLRRISKADDYDLETRTLAKYFLEVTIMDERFVGSPPSYIAAGAHCLARMMLKKGDWSPAHAYYSGYTWTQLRPLVSMMMECCEAPQKHHGAVFDKYSDRRYKRASIFVQTEMSRGFKLPAAFTPRPSLPSPEDVSSHMPFEMRDSFKRMVQIKG